MENQQQQQQQHLEEQQREQQPKPGIDFWRLSAEETEWAWALKSAVEAEDDVRPLSDMEIVHQALHAKGDTEQALRRVRGLQCFRQEYVIRDTPIEGIQLIDEWMCLHPGFLLSVDIDETYGHVVMIYDFAKRRPNDVKTDAHWRSHLGGMYYLQQAMQHNIHSCREGIVHVCEGMGWDNFSADNVRRNFSDLYDHYPLKHKEVSWLRTPTVANILFSFMKRLLDPETVARARLGCDFNGFEGRLDDLFNIPTPELAKENLLTKLVQLLVVRYHMEETFKLPDLLSTLEDTPTDHHGDSDNEDDEAEAEEDGDDEQDFENGSSDNVVGVAALPENMDVHL